MDEISKWVIILHTNPAKWLHLVISDTEHEETHHQSGWGCKCCLSLLSPYSLISLQTFRLSLLGSLSIQESEEGFCAAYCYIFLGLYKIRQCLVNSFRCWLHCRYVCFRFLRWSSWYTVNRLNNIAAWHFYWRRWFHLEIYYHMHFS